MWNQIRGLTHFHLTNSLEVRLSLPQYLSRATAIRSCRRKGSSDEIYVLSSGVSVALSFGHFAWSAEL